MEYELMNLISKNSCRFFIKFLKLNFSLLFDDFVEWDDDEAVDIVGFCNDFCIWANSSKKFWINDKFIKKFVCSHKLDILMLFFKKLMFIWNVFNNNSFVTYFA